MATVVTNNISLISAIVANDLQEVSRMLGGALYDNYTLFTTHSLTGLMEGYILYEGNILAFDNKDRVNIVIPREHYKNWYKEGKAVVPFGRMPIDMEMQLNDMLDTAWTSDNTKCKYNDWSFRRKLHKGSQRVSIEWKLPTGEKLKYKTTSSKVETKHYTNYKRIIA